MYSPKVTEIIKKLEQINQFVQSGIIFWNSLILPIIITIFVTYLLDVYKTENSEFSIIVLILALLVVLLHACFIFLQFKGSSIDTMLSEYQEKDAKLLDISDDFDISKLSYTSDVFTFSAQRKSTRFAVDALSYAIGTLRNKELAEEPVNTTELNEMLHSVIWPLVTYREALFDFKAGALWNFALYGPDEHNKLVPIWRKCDERIKPRNRHWAPGFGVVGLSYIHKKIKHEDDISNEDHGEQNTSIDAERYKSIIAIPVVPCEDGSSDTDHEPSGVLIITSNSAGQFKLDRDADFLQMYANLISILVEKIASHKAAEGGVDE
tara:strand:+ start:1050 stop:2015 length:966 start_codon:yes stop_codon:yes gene_type:complete